MEHKILTLISKDTGIAASRSVLEYDVEAISRYVDLQVALPVPDFR